MLAAVALRARSVAALGLVASTLALPASAQDTSVDLPEDYGGFVSVSDGKLMLNGGEFAFAGANSYSMLYSREQAEEQMRIAQQMGLNAIRFWGFWDGEQATLDASGEPTLPPGGTDKWGRPVLQAQPGVYGEDALRNMDYVIYLAHLYGMKLVIPLMNEWDEFGGLRQYMTWFDVDLPDVVRGCGDDGSEICFYENEDAIKAERYKFFLECGECRETYFDWVRTVLERENTFTGVKYKNDPAIMIWEIMNEPRFGPWEGDAEATVIRDFVQESARLIKSIDAQHLVASGEEGFLFADVSGKTGYAWTAAAGEGSSFSLNSAIDEIDVATFHGWPFNWAMAGEGYPDIETFMPEWIEEHARIAQDLGKPVYLGEFGWQVLRREGSDLAERNAVMEPAYDSAITENLDGIMYWHITASHTPSEAVYEGEISRNTLSSAIYFDAPIPHDQEFRFDIYCPEDVSTCDIIEAGSAAFVERVENPDPPFNEICIEPRIVCGDFCVNTASSPEHCGSCDSSCGEGEVCASGECGLTDAPEWGDNSSPYDTSGACSVAAPGTGPGSPGVLFGGLMLLAGGLAMRRSRQSS